MIVSKYFSESEFQCKCGNACLPPNGFDKKLINVLDEARHNAGEPIYVTSGYRCLAHNTACGGASQSYHMCGNAADIYCDGIDVCELKAILKTAMLQNCVKGGLQEYPAQGFVHVDTRGYWAEWC